MKKIDLEAMQRELDEKGPSGFKKVHENKDGFCAMLPYHMISWRPREGAGGVEVQIQLVHPDGRSRGIILVVPNEFLIDTAPGEHFVHQFVRRDEWRSGEFGELGIQQCPCCKGCGFVQIAGVVNVVTEGKTDE